jgi:hypothetical protein
MVNNDNRAAILAAMYQDNEAEIDDDTIDDDGYHHKPVTQAGARTRRIRVGAIEYELPSIEYVQQLERTLAQQNDTLLQQRRLIDRLAMVLARTQRANALHQLKTDEIRRELSTKLTVRSSTAT